MNSESLDKNRVKKVVFPFVLVLVALAYLTTSSIAFACNGGGGGGGGGGKNGGNGSSGLSASLRQVTQDLKDGKENFLFQSQVIKIADCKQGQLITITFPNEPSLNNVSLKAECLGNNKAIVTVPTLPDLTSPIQIQLVVKPDGSGTVTSVNTVTTQTTISGTRRAFSVFQDSTPSDWQVFSLKHSSLKISAIKKPGQKFLIRRVGTLTFLPAQFLSRKGVYHNQVLVTLPDKTLLTKSLSEL
jgi:hypothetical protein